MDCIEHKFGITLADFIAAEPQSPRIRVSLAYILAQTVFDLYDSDWMLTKWTSETIIFIKQSVCTDPRTDNGDTGVNPVKPYLAVQFPDTSTECVEECKRSIHHYPRIFALGVLLLEIGMGVSLDVARGPKPDQSPGINAEWKDAFKLAESAKKARPKEMDYPRY